MGTRPGKDQKLKAAELKLKAAQKLDQSKMRDPNNPLKSAMAGDQSSAKTMNAAVAHDVKVQEVATLPDINTTEALEPIVEELEAEIKEEDAAKVEKKRLAKETEDEIERRAEERFQEKMAVKGRQTIVTVPASNEPGNHRDCCVKMVKAIEIINRYKNGITGHDADIKIWLKMLDKVKKLAKVFSKSSPSIAVPKGKRNWSGIDLKCGHDGRENRVYKNEFIGACMMLIEASADLNWKGQMWTDYTRSILKSLQKD